VLGTVMNLPTLLALTLILAYPVIYAGWLSLHQVGIGQLRRGIFPWNNFDNYARLFAIPLFWLALKNTVVFTVVVVAVEIVLAIAIALLISQTSVWTSRGHAPVDPLALRRAADHQRAHLVVQPEREQRAIEEAELEAVDERPDEPVGDRRHAVGQRINRRVTRDVQTLVWLISSAIAIAQHDLDGDDDDGEHDGVLQREPEQGSANSARIVELFHGKMPRRSCPMPTWCSGEPTGVDHGIARISVRASSVGSSSPCRARRRRARAQQSSVGSLPPCGGRVGRGVNHARPDMCLAPPPPAPPRKGEGSPRWRGVTV